MRIFLLPTWESLSLLLISMLLVFILLLANLLLLSVSGITLIFLKLAALSLLSLISFLFLSTFFPFFISLTLSWTPSLNWLETFYGVGTTGVVDSILLVGIWLLFLNLKGCLRLSNLRNARLALLAKHVFSIANNIDKVWASIFLHKYQN